MSSLLPKVWILINIRNTTLNKNACFKRPIALNLVLILHSHFVFLGNIVNVSSVTGLRSVSVFFFTFVF